MGEHLCVRDSCESAHVHAFAAVWVYVCVQLRVLPCVFHVCLLLSEVRDCLIFEPL